MSKRTGKKMWAEQYADSCDNESGSFLSHQLKAIREKAHIEGFNKAIEQASGLITDLSPSSNLPILIRAIGTAEVGPDGKPVGWDR